MQATIRPPKFRQDQAEGHADKKLGPTQRETLVGSLVDH